MILKNICSKKATKNLLVTNWIYSKKPALERNLTNPNSKTVEISNKV